MCERRSTYLVGLVVVLGVVFEERLLLRVVPDGHRLVELGLFPPRLAVDEPSFRSRSVGGAFLPRTAQRAGLSHIFFDRLTSNFRARRNRSYHNGLRVSSCTVELPDTPEGHTYQSQRIEAVGVALSLEQQAQLVDLGLLLRGEMSRVTRAALGGSRREVIVVVLGVQRHGRVFGCHGEDGMAVWRYGRKWVVVVLVEVGRGVG